MSEGILHNITVNEQLVKMKVAVSTKYEALDILSNCLLSHHKVSSSFAQAIKRREDEFPTGLMLENIGVAIPHTDVEHVVEQSMAIGILEEPVDFTIMGTENDLVKVKVIFMLALKEPHTQLEFLQTLVQIFQDDSKILKLLECQSPSEIITVFKGYF